MFLADFDLWLRRPVPWDRSGWYFHEEVLMLATGLFEKAITGSEGFRLLSFSLMFMIACEETGW